jgi:hypothetical protein
LKSLHGFLSRAEPDPRRTARCGYDIALRDVTSVFDCAPFRHPATTGQSRNSRRRLGGKIAVPTQVIRRAVVFIHEIWVRFAKMADQARGKPFSRRMASGPKNAWAIVKYNPVSMNRILSGAQAMQQAQSVSGLGAALRRWRCNPPAELHLKHRARGFREELNPRYGRGAPRQFQFLQSTDLGGPVKLRRASARSFGCEQHADRTGKLPGAPSFIRKSYRHNHQSQLYLIRCVA